MVRQRGEEFTPPKELKFQPSLKGDEGNEVELVQEDLLVLDKRGESEFCSRFRTSVADLKLEGVKLPEAEIGVVPERKDGT